jgi:hypothetical protein
MKAEELMIGDWVNIFEVQKQIEGIRTFKNGDEMVYYDGDNGNFIKNVTAIPLTSAILEKNSFLKVESIVYDEPRIGVSYLYRITPEGLRIFVQNACVGGPTCTMIKTCKYVHEVQHMIKMCDIEKTFVL